MTTDTHTELAGTGGLTGDFGWGDADDASAWGGAGSAVLVVASSLYGAAVWLANGLPPIPYLLTRVRNPRTPTTPPQP
jgi:hypothetical protein